MDFESDEMFKVLKFKMSDWANAARIAQTAANLSQTGSAGLSTNVTKGGKDKNAPNSPVKEGGAGAAAQEEMKVPVVEEDTTPAREKKNMTKPMAKEYQPKQVEAAWYSWWQQKKFFHADEKKVLANPDAKKFVMVIPPPNVTGALHLGHALMLAIEDAISRWKRMSGYETLWLPGVDHAGIATQSVVEKQLWKKEKKTRHDLGRDQFIKTVWDWKEEYGGRIVNQFSRYGISVDWDRFAFTLDEKRYKAVIEAFVRMHEKGLIYRTTRLVNWSCALKTALSDLEVEYLDIKGPTFLKVPGHDPNKKYEFGTLTEFVYKVKGMPGKEIVVATTRLETMLGDVAVAVHPDDPRYQDLIGKELEHPFIPDRHMTVIADGILVDMNYGTGAVKITPAHDPNDYACGKRQELAQINILDEDGRINHNGGKYEGLMRYDCRVQIFKDMEAMGIIKGKKPNPMRLGLCSKSNDIIEPFLKP
jgi:valyl-tRNA synthetase